eukprot:TRINITY_DN209_c1_g1_i2.p1 TRINITY_DN209_c1_g1~~TRINITY_DN209_c1_g1_i2.p1  ORF type:complete len:395 (-),score=110.70 TRINITY_DN209_c1_g1_i2:222-1406(-)
MDSPAATLAAMLEVPVERAQQLLEAATGSMERAVELHYSAQSEDVPSSGQKRPAAAAAAAGGAAAAAASAGAASRSPPKPTTAIQATAQGQRKISMFFGSTPSASPDKAGMNGTGSPFGTPDSSSRPSQRPRTDPVGMAATAVRFNEVQNAASGDPQPAPICLAQPTAAEHSCAAPETGQEQSVAASPPAAAAAAVAPAEPAAASPPSAVAATAVSGGRESRLDVPWAQYHPVNDACWTAGEPPPFMHLAAAFESLAATTKRLKKADILANCFRSLLALTPEDLLPAVFLSCNKVAENMEGVDMGVGGSQVTSAILQATGTKPEQLRRLNRSTGDLGDAAQACKANQRLLASPKPLTIRGVHDALLGLARDGGTGSEGRKVSYSIYSLDKYKRL